MSSTLSAGRSRSRRTKRTPWGMLVALFTACFVTLIGVFSGFEPFVVLVRASVSAILLGGIVSLGSGVIHLANVGSRSRQDEKSTRRRSR